MNTTITKQNKILLAALIVILAAAAILIAVTGGANKKEKAETPITDNQQENGTVIDEGAPNTPDKTTTQEITPKKPDADEIKKNEAAKKEEAKEEAKEDSAEIDTPDEEVASMQDEALPKFSAPVDNFVIKGYSSELPVFSYTMNDYRTHNGVDIACSAGTPIFSAADGMVCEVANDPMMGVTVAVQHSGGALTRYEGLSAESLNLVGVGDEVKRGQVIGASGDTALIESAEEPHVHFELLIDGESKNPSDYMKLTHISDVLED